MFHKKNNKSPQQQTIDFLRSDPNFTTHLNEFEKVQKERATRTVITPHKYDLNRIDVIQNIRHRMVDYDMAYTSYERQDRTLFVTANGEIEIYKNGEKITEDLNNYIFSKEARDLKQFIQDQHFYKFEKMPHCEKLIFTKDIKEPGEFKIGDDFIKMKHASYSLGIERDGNINYRLDYQGKVHQDTVSGSYIYDDVTKIPHKEIADFHHKVIQPYFQQQVQTRPSLSV